jgi:hypothetical protein
MLDFVVSVAVPACYLAVDVPGVLPPKYRHAPLPLGLLVHFQLELASQFQIQLVASDR